jgi:glycine cleavage system H protein
MANIPGDRMYTAQHEWAQDDGDRVRVGITAYAQEQLGDVVFVELPPVGAAVTQHGGFGVVESVKAVSDLFAPLSGTVVAVNGELAGTPEVVNQDPYGRGWMILIAPSAPAERANLLTAAQYEALLARGEH